MAIDLLGLAAGMDEYGDGPWITDEKQRDPLKVCQVYQLHGPPGCGKTTALATVWIPRAVDLFGSDGVAVCSLTKAAAVEIAARGLTVDPEMVGTLHALSFRALGRPPLTVGKVDKWNDVALPQHRLTAQRGPSTAFDDPGDSRGGPADGDALLGSVELLRHCRTPEEQWPPAEREWYAEWSDWKRAEGLVDFTDLIEQAVEYTDAPKGNPSALIVDEAQDLSRLEHRLIAHWANGCEMLVLAGDGDQSIYSWRGADAQAFANRDDVAPENQRELTQSYRVPATVVAYAQQWIAQHEGPRHAVDYRPRQDKDGNPVNGELTHLPQATMRGGAVHLVNDIEESIADGGNAMVLASCSYLLAATITELRRRGIPFFNPFRKANGAWNPMRGGIDRLLSFLQPTNGTWTWKQLHQWLDPLAADKGTFVHGAKATAKLRSKATHEDYLIDSVELRAVFTPDGLAGCLAALSDPDPLEAVAWYMRLVRGSMRAKFAYAETIVRTRGIGALLEAPSVVIGTIHSVKGAASDTVYLAPDISKRGMEDWEKGGTAADETVRLFYVGMTRARNRLVLLGPSSRDCVRWV